VFFRHNPKHEAGGRLNLAIKVIRFNVQVVFFQDVLARFKNFLKHLVFYGINDISNYKRD